MMDQKIRKIFNPTEYAQLWAKYYDDQAKSAGSGIYRTPDNIRVLEKPISKTRKKKSTKKAHTTVKKKVINRDSVKKGDVFRKVKAKK